MRCFHIFVDCPVYRNAQKFYVYTDEEHYYPTGCNGQDANNKLCEQCHLAIYRKYESKDRSLFDCFFGK